MPDKSLSEGRSREIVAELMAHIETPQRPPGDAAFSEEANPVLEGHVGPIRPPRFTSTQLRAAIRAALAGALRPLSEKEVASKIVRAAGGVSADARLTRRIGHVLRMTRGLAVRAGDGWQAPGRELPPTAPAQPPQQQAEAEPGRLLRPDEAGYREQQSRIAQKGWRDRDYLAPPRKGEPA